MRVIFDWPHPRLSLCQLCLQLGWLRHRRLTREIAAHIGRGLPIHQTAILHQRDLGTLWTGRAQGHDLEGPVPIANDAQQSLRVGGAKITHDGDLLWLRKSICQCLESLPETQRILAHHGLHLSQCLVRDVDITQGIGEVGQLEQGGDRHRIP
jgi:hypothetical protein